MTETGKMRAWAGETGKWTGRAEGLMERCRRTGRQKEILQVFRIPVLCSRFQRFAPCCCDPCVFPRLTRLFLVFFAI